MLKAITYSCRWDVVPDLKHFNFSVHFQNKNHIYLKMAEGYQSPLQHPDVIRYFEDILEVNRSIVMSLYRKNLISDAQKEEIIQQATPKDRARTCGNILIRNVTKEMMPILNKVLKDHKFKTIEEILTWNAHDHDLNPGHTDPFDMYDNMHIVTIYSSEEESTDQMNEHSVNDYSSVDRLRESNFDAFDTQPGCIHIFLHSEKPFYQELCDAENCRLYITKCMTLENVKETLKQGQIIRVVIKKNAYSLPLKDEKGKKLEFNKMQVIKINRHFINGEMKNASQIFQKMIPETDIFEMKDRQVTDILLDLMKDETDKVWATFISLLPQFGNETIANRLEKMICAECYRTTIINDIKNIAVEIDTDLMEETFKGKTIPKAVIEKCILTKGELPRVERAKYFLQYVLLKGEMVTAFADVLSCRSRVVLNFSPCETHGSKHEISPNDVDKEFTFQVCKNGTDHFYLTKTQEAVHILSKGSKSGNYDEQDVASQGLPNGNKSGNSDDEQISSKKEILHNLSGKNGFSHLK